MLTSENIMAAAAKLHDCWRAGEVIDTLGADLHPAEPADGYAIQAAGARLRDETVIGWKIAATSQAGRDHINVDRPLAGRMFESAVFESGATVSLSGSRMLVAEAEFVFVMGASLQPRPDPFTEIEVKEAIGQLHPGLELPDSRFSDFTQAGTAGLLIADNACASQFVLGPAAPIPFSADALGDHPTTLFVNDQAVSKGRGADALGGPLTALTWLVNTLRTLEVPLLAGQFVTTGVTGQPSPVKAGDTCTVDLGNYGRVSAQLV